MLSRENDVTDVTWVNENRVAEQDFQNLHDMLVMGKGVEESDFLDINVETSEGLGAVLFTDEDTASTDSGIGIGIWVKEFMLICHL